MNVVTIKTKDSSKCLKRYRTNSTLLNVHSLYINPILLIYRSARENRLQYNYCQNNLSSEHFTNCPSTPIAEALI